MHVDLIVLREAERMKGWLVEGRWCTLFNKAGKIGVGFKNETRQQCGGDDPLYPNNNGGQ